MRIWQSPDLYKTTYIHPLVNEIYTLHTRITYKEKTIEIPIYYTPIFEYDQFKIIAHAIDHPIYKMFSKIVEPNKYWMRITLCSTAYSIHNQYAKEFMYELKPAYTKFIDIPKKENMIQEIVQWRESLGEKVEIL